MVSWLDGCNIASSHHHNYIHDMTYYGCVLNSYSTRQDPPFQSGASDKADQEAFLLQVKKGFMHYP